MSVAAEGSSVAAKGMSVAAEGTSVAAEGPTRRVKPLSWTSPLMGRHISRPTFCKG